MVKALVFDFSRVLLNTKELKDTQEYSLFDYFKLNQTLLDYISTLREKYSLYIFTTGSIQNEPEIKKILQPFFREIFTVEYLGSKTNPQTYLKLASIIKLNPEEILFIDDSEENILAAKQARLQTIHFQQTDRAIKEIQQTI